ncbi:hypothetical protein [Deinococcus arcticus]|uniref:hypothetical protein n=1 Tax=Deinococcus arcticus TaxID=2136176 RepID=UPI0013047C5D|nr:hypothetical protein [Deinococcus arcticus]
MPSSGLLELLMLLVVATALLVGLWLVLWLIRRASQPGQSQRVHDLEQRVHDLERR